MIRRFAVAMLVVGAGHARAQDVRLQSRMDPDTYRVVRGIIDSARKTGLPARPIEDKALEGASAGVPGPAIVAAIRVFTVHLATASAALGRRATTDELRAAVGAIDAGVPPRDLVRIRAAAESRSVATALTVMGDIVVRGVPVATATNLVISLLRARVKDVEVLNFGRAVRHEVSRGADPAAAAAVQARKTILAFGMSRVAS